MFINNLTRLHRTQDTYKHSFVFSPNLLDLQLRVTIEQLHTTGAGQRGRSGKWSRITPPLDAPDGPAGYRAIECDRLSIGGQYVTGRKFGR